jgi:predicted nucleic acid-binding protein
VINNLLIDAGPLVAIFNKSNKHHQACISFLSGYHGDIFTTEPVLTEVVYLLRRFPAGPQKVIDFIINAPVKLIPLFSRKAVALFSTDGAIRQCAHGFCRRFPGSPGGRIRD